MIDSGRLEHRQHLTRTRQKKIVSFEGPSRPQPAAASRDGRVDIDPAIPAQATQAMWIALGHGANLVSMARNETGDDNGGIARGSDVLKSAQKPTERFISAHLDDC